MDTQETISGSVSIGRVAGRVTVVGLVLYVISLIYRAGAVLMAVTLVGIVSLYAVVSLLRDLRYGFTPWEPIEWTPISPSELPKDAYQRALRWTLALKSILIVGALSGLVFTFATGLRTLGYVLLIGGVPTQIVVLTKHYVNGTKPWYPSVPTQPD